MTWKAFKTVMRQRGARALGLTVIGVAGMAVVVGGVACRANTEARTSDVADTAAAPLGAPVLVSCPAGEQALIRQIAVNGDTASQIECVSVDAAPSSSAHPAAPSSGASADTASTYPPAYRPEPWQAPPPQSYAPHEPGAVPSEADRAETAPSAGPTPAVYEPGAAPAVEPRVVRHEPRPQPKRPTRSWQKSAVIIGASSAVGAGVGGATGGKKGALIGAAVGGGGAAIWDAVTRSR